MFIEVIDLLASYVRDRIKGKERKERKIKMEKK
jgi:hypothetical protein